MNIDLDQTSPKVLSCLERLANKLDNIAIALDLASACNRDDIDNRLDPDDIVTESTAVAAIEQYFVDLAEHKEGVLSDLEQNAANAYKKTVWTVWEAVLSSLKRSEQRDAAAGIYPMQSLGLAVVLGSTTVHHEVFRAASQSLVAICSGLGIDLPLWFKSLLGVSENGVWDSFAYRASTARLMRFNLIHPATQDILSPEKGILDTHARFVSWPGFTMHGLV
jgi:hypothetical protein